MLMYAENSHLKFTGSQKIQFRTAAHQGANTYDEIPVMSFYM